MTNIRFYGKSPFSVVVVHGGPGAAGEMRPVAKTLSKYYGVIEPLQTEDSVKGQIEELKKAIEENTTTPIFLVGWSWGAWLSYLLATYYPELVKKLIIVSSGPFEASHAQEVMKTRLNRLTVEGRDRANKIMLLIQNGKADSRIFSEFGKLMDKADSFDQVKHKEEVHQFQQEIYEKVWAEAEELRKSGKLLEAGKAISCPVVAVHGDYDPHPAEGVKKPLSKIIKNFKFYLLKNCGHHPWYEREARDRFYKVLKRELIS